MANTEGMSDEVVESLLGPSLSTSGHNNYNNNNNNNNNISNATSSRRRRAMEQRMEMGMGDQPAARVIRASPNQNNAKPKPSSSFTQGENVPSQDKPAPPPAIMGNIVERSKLQKQKPQPQGAPTKGSENDDDDAQRTTKRQSRFAQQRQKMMMPSDPSSKTTGFPSVNVPLGTFVKPKKKKVQNNNTTTSASGGSARSVAVDSSKANTNSSNSKTAKNATTSSLGSLQQASAQDANSMFEQMTMEERAEKAQELQQALSPETIAFLKKRAALRNNNNKGDNNTLSDDDQVPASSKAHSSVSFTQPIVENNQNSNDTKEISSTVEKDVMDKTSVEEKKRLADILSKIRSVDDLDAAYHAEMGNYSPLESDLFSSKGTSKTEEEGKTPFQLACDLLRSTSPRQNLWAAQVVSKQLQQHWEAGDTHYVAPGGHSTASSPSYPVMLPASLRCLLDASISQTNGYVLHTYVLQSLYNLLRLYACPDHIVNVDGGAAASPQTDAAAIYQQCFLEDAVPTPTVGTCYEPIAAVEPLDSTDSSNPAPGAAYKTSSSSTSAQKDGEAFAKDPMWTLLSRMCIIPRLAQVVRIAAQTTTSQERLIPREAIVAMCGILAMISQRSPGAATAIVNHQTLLSHLLEASVMPQADSQSQRPYDTVVAIPAMRLLCTLARQSRVAAADIPFDDVVPPLLAIEAATKEEHCLQKWSVMLWRILLRYGLGGPQIPIMLTVAAPHMALDPGLGNNSLSTEFCTSFVNILHCVQIARRHAMEKSDNSETHNLGHSISDEQLDTFMEADAWLVSSARQIIAQLETSSSAEASNFEIMQFHSGRLQFLSTFLRVGKEKLGLAISNGESKSDNDIVSYSWFKACQQILTCFVDQGFLQDALASITPEACLHSFAEQPTSGKEVTMQNSEECLREATACAFLCSFVSLLLSLLDQITAPTGDAQSPDDEIIRDSIKSLVNRFILVLKDSISGSTAGVTVFLKHNQSSVPVARRGWLNRACFSIIELLIAAKDLKVFFQSDETSHCHLLRRLQFSLLGRLDRGDEAMAAILFSQDYSFRPPVSPEDNAILSAMFFRELCSTDASRGQLDHSFKLRHGPGITPEELGPFKMHSLLSDADLPASSGKATTPDFVLPIGPLWLWQVLSSSIRAQAREGAQNVPEREREAEAVLSSCLNLILELEREEAVTDASITCDAMKYASLISPGSKVYHLLNICFHPKSLLESEHLITPAQELLTIYENQVDAQFDLEFAQACMQHSELTNKVSKEDSTAKTADLNDHVLEHSGNLSKRHFHALEAFSGDLSEVYIEYGAQYDFFTRFLRVLFLPNFHPKIRSDVMKRVGELMHLVSLPGEDDPASAQCREHLSALLERSIQGALPDRDGSSRDHPDFLDAIAVVYSKGGSPRLVFGYFFLLGVLVHSRHLAICLQPNATGLQAAKQRLKYVHPGFVSVVVDATGRSLKFSDQSKTQLVNATMEAVTAFLGREDAGGGNHEDGFDLDEAVEQLKSFVK